MSHAALPTYATLDGTLVSDHVLQVCLNRPEVGNALNTQMGVDLLDLWTRLTDVPGEVRCVVFTTLVCVASYQAFVRKTFVSVFLNGKKYS